MQSQRAIRLALAIVSAAPFALAQQTYVTRYDLFTGYTFLYSPSIGLSENGFHTQAGMRTNKWLSIGFDYSISAGDLNITPNLLPSGLQQQLGAQLAALAAAGLLPPGYSLVVPSHSLSQTFALGPQLSYRHFKKVTIFVRPSLGAIREKATPHPRDPIAAKIVAGLVPSGHKVDWTGFYGFGYGFDVNLTNHFAIRTQGDLVWDHLFNDLLARGRWTTRFSVGPAFNFGRNILEHH